MQETKAKKPELGAFAQAIASQILQDGPMTVADYMGLAAQRYYAEENPFGTQGDFTTAPEISQLFGEVIAAWLIDVWMQMGRPENIQLIELGPGRGTLMADIMRVITQWPEMRSAVTVHLVETSAQLREKQAEALRLCRPVWYDSFEEVPLGLSLIIANEFFDALPIHQFEKLGGAWQERRVKFSEPKQAFEFTHLPPEFDVAAIMPEDFIKAQDGSIFEVSPASFSVMETICKRIDGHGGAALLIDYGHDKPGLGDTLQAMHKHSFVAALENPGAHDITAQVDFGTLGTIAAEYADVHGAVTQGAFLTGLGINERGEVLRAQGNQKQQWDIALALKRLTAPSEMGTLFKVMALTQKGSDVKPAGFGEGQHDAQD